ncbi:MAG: disulfide bond formation protein B [Acetobacterales bacterium]
MTPRTDAGPSPRLLAAALLAAAAAPLAAAYAAQYLGGLQPCVLCLYQRVPFAVVAVLALAALAMPRLLRPLLWLSAAALACGAVIAAYHVGVEQRWWESFLAGCGGGATAGAQTVEELRAALLETPPVRCDAVAWSLFGISMAGYNVFYSLAVAALCAAAAAIPLRGAREP